MNAVDASFTPFYTGWDGTIATATYDDSSKPRGGRDMNRR